MLHTSSNGFSQEFQEIEVTDEDFLSKADPASTEDVTLSHIFPDDVTSPDDIVGLLSDSPPQTHPLPKQVADGFGANAQSSVECSDAPSTSAIPSTVQELADRIDESETGNLKTETDVRTEGRCDSSSFTLKLCPFFDSRVPVLAPIKSVKLLHELEYECYEFLMLSLQVI